jgi:hypothetical protein
VLAVESDGKAIPIVASGSSFNPMEQDVISALQNLGCSRPAAEEAVRKAKSKGEVNSFEPFFRTALALVR